MHAVSPTIVPTYYLYYTFLHHFFGILNFKSSMFPVVKGQKIRYLILEKLQALPLAYPLSLF